MGGAQTSVMLTLSMAFCDFHLFWRVSFLVLHAYLLLPTLYLPSLSHSSLQLLSLSLYRTAFQLNVIQTCLLKRFCQPTPPSVNSLFPCLACASLSLSLSLSLLLSFCVPPLPFPFTLFCFACVRFKCFLCCLLPASCRK